MRIQAKLIKINDNYYLFSGIYYLKEQKDVYERKCIRRV
jgi:hypothetical protein